jgi:hypothetical protein
MDPITALATIVQLLGLYRQETNRREDMNSEAFMRWLQAHNHNELKEIIFNQTYLQEQVTELLRTDHQHIIAQLDRLSELTMSIAQQFDGLAPISRTGPPDRRLPTQAIDLLHSLAVNDAQGFQLIPIAGGVKLPVLIPSGQTGQLPEPQFIEEDCDLLTSLGFIRQRISQRGDTQYIITRAGVDFARSLPTKN